jgi:hypothetical protein
MGGLRQPALTLRAEPASGLDAARIDQAQGVVLIRVQDRFGRGPYRPGFSHVWSDPNGPAMRPWWDELGLDFADANERIYDEYYNGCGFRCRDQLHAWFTERELRALDRHGYRLAAVKAHVIHFETPTQVVFGSIEPLSVPLRSCRLTSRAAQGLAA